MSEGAKLALVVGKVDEVVFGAIAEITEAELGDVEWRLLSHFHHIVRQVIVADRALSGCGAGQTVLDEIQTFFTFLAGLIDEVVGLARHTLI